MLERVLIALAAAVVAVIAYRALTRAQLRKAATSACCDSLLDGFRPGVPAIVYFSTPTCGPCKTVQTPAIKTLEAELGDRIQVYCVDCAEDIEAANRWGVFSVPTTFILDGQGRPREVNHGFADAARLRRQLEAVIA